MNNKKVIEFLREYEKLCRKYGLELAGCGCCGSPWVAKIEETDLLTWRDGFKEIDFAEQEWYQSERFGAGFVLREDGTIEKIEKTK